MPTPESENILLGVRKPDRNDIEFSMLPVRTGSGNMLPVLRRDYSVQPTRAFNDTASNRRIIHVPDSIPFHDIARQVHATRWFLHQSGEWHYGAVRPQHPHSLLARMYHMANAYGGDRFTPNIGSLNNIDRNGLRRHCVMGMATELFMDDYPSALYRVEKPSEIQRDSLNVVYQAHHIPRERQLVYLPDIVRRALGFRTNDGEFLVDAKTAGIMAHKHALQLPVGYNWNLVHINDSTLNWPATAELLALPAPGLMER